MLPLKQSLWILLSGIISSILFINVNVRAEETNLSSIARNYFVDNQFIESQPQQKIYLSPTTITLKIPHSDAYTRWSRFETEFAIHDKNPSLFFGAIESAKERLDWTSLEMRDWIDTLQNSLSFDYELRNLIRSTPAIAPARPIRGNILRDAWENARFQSDINLSHSGRAFVGVKLTLPIGN